jgi:uncharacterized protein YkwD
MEPFLRIAAAVLVVVSLGVSVVRHPPTWLRHEVDRARASQDPWAAYVAPASSCAGGSDAVSQERSMVCLLNYARGKRGLEPLRVLSQLNRSSILKALAIVHCHDFSHTPCGKPFRATFDAVGYRGPVSTSFGENIAWGTGDAGVPRAVVSSWLNSPHHRENLFTKGWAEQGVAVFTVANFLGSHDVEIWVSEFGARH